MSDSLNTGGPGERELFAIAAEHFTDAKLDEQAMDEVWDLLADAPHTAAELADALGQDVGELEAFLSWGRERGIFLGGGLVVVFAVYAPKLLAGIRDNLSRSDRDE